MPSPVIPHYYFKQTNEGALAIEGDQPYQGAVTITWRPSVDFPGRPIDMVIPAALFATVALDYVTDVASVPKKKA